MTVPLATALRPLTGEPIGTLPTDSVAPGGHPGERPCPSAHPRWTVHSRAPVHRPVTGWIAPSAELRREMGPAWRRTPVDPGERVRQRGPVTYEIEKPRPGDRTGLRYLRGSDLLSHPVSRAVPSALEGLTSLFGMGRGVSPPPTPPQNRMTIEMRRGSTDEAT